MRVPGRPRLTLHRLLTLTVLAAVPALAGAASWNGVPGVELIWYDVSGTTAAEINAAVERARPTDDTGQRVDGLTEHRFLWRWPVINGRCDLKRATVEFEARVTLPRLVNLASLPASLQQDWGRRLAGLEEHEKGHVLNAWNRRGDVLAAIRGATCATANDAAKKILREIDEADIEYDRRTDQGRRQAAPL